MTDVSEGAMGYRVVGGEEGGTEVFVEPSDEVKALLRLMPGFVALPPETPPGVRRLARDALVAPLTQLTFLSFDLQMYLFGVFHSTWVARAGHLVGMVGVNFFVMAGLSRATAGASVFGQGLDAGTVYAALLLSWYAAISRDARLGAWWAAMVPVVGGLWLGSRAWLLAVADLSGPASSPWTWVLASGLVIMGSHAAEPLFPPRAGDAMAWMSIRDFVLGRPGAPNPPGLAVRRALRVGVYPFFGLVDELWAAPRLLPYTVLDLLFRAGYAPRRRAELEDRVRRATASGNPAIDFVGIGGGATLAPPE